MKITTKEYALFRICLELGNASQSYTESAASSIFCGIAVSSLMNYSLTSLACDASTSRSFVSLCCCRTPCWLNLKLFAVATKLLNTLPMLSVCPVYTHVTLVKWCDTSEFFLVCSTFFWCICFFRFFFFKFSVFWLWWIFIAEWLSLVAASRGYSLVTWALGLLIAVVWLQLPGSSAQAW